MPPKVQLASPGTFASFVLEMKDLNRRVPFLSVSMSLWPRAPPSVVWTLTMSSAQVAC